MDTSPFLKIIHNWCVDSLPGRVQNQWFLLAAGFELVCTSQSDTAFGEAHMWHRPASVQ